jgi:hypothetical protein
MLNSIVDNKKRMGPLRQNNGGAALPLNRFKTSGTAAAARLKLALCRYFEDTIYYILVSASTACVIL